MYSPIYSPTPGEMHTPPSIPSASPSSARSPASAHAPQRWPSSGTSTPSGLFRRPSPSIDDMDDAASPQARSYPSTTVSSTQRSQEAVPMRPPSAALHEPQHSLGLNYRATSANVEYPPRPAPSRSKTDTRAIIGAASRSRASNLTAAGNATRGVAPSLATNHATKSERLEAPVPTQHVLREAARSSAKPLKRFRLEGWWTPGSKSFKDASSQVDRRHRSGTKQEHVQSSVSFGTTTAAAFASRAALAPDHDGTISLQHVSVSPYGSAARIPEPTPQPRSASGTIHVEDLTVLASLVSGQLHPEGRVSATSFASSSRGKLPVPEVPSTESAGTPERARWGSAGLGASLSASSSTSSATRSPTSRWIHPSGSQREHLIPPRGVLSTHVSIISNVSSYQDQRREGDRNARTSSVARIMFVLGFLVPMCWLVGGWLTQRSTMSRLERGKRENLIALFVRDRWNATPWAGPAMPVPLDSDMDLEAMSKPEARLDPWVRRCRVAAFVGGLVIFAACIVAVGVVVHAGH